MRTTKPISTISYNSPAFLELKLNELLKAGRISFWAFIPHAPEDDEAGLKPHSHVYIEPSKMLQSDDLRNELKEFDPSFPAKPLGCLAFRSSKFGEWYLYGLHDKAYLATKGESRKYHYCHDNFYASDYDDLLFMARTIDRKAISPYAAMLEAQSLGLTWQEYFARGTVPLPQLALFERAWYTLLQTNTSRNGRPGHVDAIESDTGEVVEMIPPAAESVNVDSDQDELPW